jgi:hypothetical protein
MDAFTINDLIPSKYLKQSDVDGEVVVTVAAVKRANVAREDEPPDMKWMVQFAEFNKPFVLNTTNKKRLFKALGDTTDQWIGHNVILYVDENVEYAGEVTGGLRIKAVPPVQRPTTRKVPVTDARGEIFVNDVPND